MKRWTILGLVVIVAIVAITSIVILTAKFEEEQAVRLNIPQGATSESVRDSMRTSLGEGFGSTVYRLWSLAAGNAAKSHGSYLIEPGMSALTAARRVAGGQQTPVRVTIGTGWRTLDDLTKRLSKKIEASPARIKQAVSAVLANDSTYSSPEQYTAAFVPDTYEFYWTDSPEYVVNKLLQERNKFWNSDRLRKAEKLGLTPVEVTTLASIVEEESNKKDEHPMIARLYMNRLDKGMRLQADPTVKFATGNFGLRRITGKHLKTKSPYNTYLNTGLPPGPIRIPQKSTIDAVLNAPQHDYIYMCAKSDFSGRHDFATTYAQHKRNAKRYVSQLNKRGIR